jgi:RNA polymerase sigma-70 factor (ECF subfamily)
VGELELLQQAKTGNKSAMNSLLKDNYKILYGYILKMTGNIQNTEDIVQETMLKALINIEKFKPDAKFSTWLITIGTNLYRDSLRKNKRIVELEEAELCSNTSIEEEVLARVEFKRAIEILMKLSYEKRAAFILKNYYGYKYEEIAKILDCPIGTVRSRIHYCVQYISNALKGSEDNYE